MIFEKMHENLYSTEMVRHSWSLVLEERVQMFMKRHCIVSIGRRAVIGREKYELSACFGVYIHGNNVHMLTRGMKVPRGGKSKNVVLEGDRLYLTCKHLGCYMRRLEANNHVTTSFNWKASVGRKS